MKRILVAVDQTPESRIVLEAAAALARSVDARVRLVHVVVPAVTFAPMPGRVPATGLDPVPALVAQAQDHLAQLQTEFFVARTEPSLVEVGPAADTLLRVVRAERPDLVVLGAHGHGAVARAVGTTAGRIVNAACASVLIVRHPAGGARERHGMLRIVAAVDSSDTADAVVARANALAFAPGARIRLLRVEPYLDQIRSKFARNLDGSDANLDRLEAAISPERRDGVAIARGTPAATICAFATEYDADIVVMGSHAYGWTERLLGTTAAWVVDHIDRPLLVVRDASRVVPSFQLRAEHTRLDRIYLSLVDAFRAGEWALVQSEWALFEPALRAHMEREEREFFPRFRSVYPGETASLEGEHSALRERLDSFAIAIELHEVVLRDAEELVTTLRQHARREEQIFYPWLDITGLRPAAGGADAAGVSQGG